MEPRAVERFTDAMNDEEPEPQTLTPYALDRTTGFYVQPSPRHPLLWCGVNSTLFGKHPLDQHPEPHGAS